MIFAKFFWIKSIILISETLLILPTYSFPMFSQEPMHHVYRLICPAIEVWIKSNLGIWQLTLQFQWVFIDFNIPAPPLTTKATTPRPPLNSARIGDIWPALVCDRRWKDRKVQTTFTFSKTAFVCPYSWCSRVVGPLLQKHIFLPRRCKFVQYKWLAKRSFILSVPAQKSVKRTPHRQSDVSIGNAVMKQHHHFVTKDIPIKSQMLPALKLCVAKVTCKEKLYGFIPSVPAQKSL